MSDNNGLARVQSGEVVRQEFGADQLARSAETSQTAMAAAADAEIKAAYVMARANRRSWAAVRVDLLHHCERPTFAAAAIYRKPVGRGEFKEGLSVKFAEVARSECGNLWVSTKTIYDDAEKRIERVRCVDLEKNNPEEVDIPTEKTMERKFLKDGQIAIRSRVNSYGELVHLVPADEGAFMLKVKAERMKTWRDVVLRQIPRDIRDECFAKCKQIQADQDARDPDAAKKQLFDVFAKEIGVKPTDIEEYLGHGLDIIGPVELAELRGVFAAVRDGDCSWTEALGAKLGVQIEGKTDPKMAAIKEKIAEKTQRAAAKKAPAQKPKTAPREDAGELSPDQERGRQMGDD